MCSLLHKNMLAGVCLFFSCISFAQKDIRNYDSLTYKDGSPYEGSKKNGKEWIRYKKGKRDGVQIKYDPYGYIWEKSYYSIGVLDSVIYPNFIVADKYNLKGIYKNGKPFEGYFLNEENENLKELFLQMDWFVAGQREKVFSKSILYDIITAYRTKTDITDEQLRSYKLPVTSIYKDGKLYTGVNYFSPNDNRKIFYEQYITAGKINRINIGFFDLNSVGLSAIEILPDGYKLSGYTINEKGNRMNIDTQTVQIKYAISNGKKGNVVFTFNNRIRRSNDFELYPIGNKESIPGKNTLKEYRLINDTIMVQESINAAFYPNLEIDNEYSYLGELPFLYDIDFDDPMQIRSLFEIKLRPKILATLSCNDKGNLYGIDIQKNVGSNTYSYTMYDFEDSSIKTEIAKPKITKYPEALTLKELIKKLDKKLPGEEN